MIALEKEKTLENQPPAYKMSLQCMEDDRVYSETIFLMLRFLVV